MTNQIHVAEQEVYSNDAMMSYLLRVYKLTCQPRALFSKAMPVQRSASVGGSIDH